MKIKAKSKSRSIKIRSKSKVGNSKKKYKPFPSHKKIESNQSIYIKYNLYKKQRKKIQFKYIDNSFFFDKSAKIAIIVPYRNREEHLKEFYKHFQNETFDVYVIEQCDSQKFNRGLLLNAGFDIASKKKDYDYYIFHDVDSLPDSTLLKNYYYKGNKIIHYASPYLGYKYTFSDFFGGIIGMNKETFEKINGFPNNFFGWGGEDDALYNHIALSNYKEVYRPQIGSYLLLDHDKPTKDEINKHKMYNILKDLKYWNIYGYKDIPHLYILQDHFPYKSTHMNKSKSKSTSRSKNKLNIEVYQLKIAIVHKEYVDNFSLLEPLVTWNEIEDKIISTYDQDKIKKYVINKNIQIKPEIEKIVNDKIEKEYEAGLEKSDLEKTLKFIFETYKEILYFRIRNHKIILGYHIHNIDFQNNWTQYIKFPNGMSPKDFLNQKRKDIKSFYEPLLPKNKWTANNCIINMEGDVENGNPISYIKEIYIMITNTIKYFKNVPDCDLLINRKDFQYLHSNPLKYAYTYIYPENMNIHNSLLPKKYWIVASQNSSISNKDVPIPNADEWKDIHKNVHKIDWKDKNNQLLFRGSSTGCGLNENNNPRIRLSQISYLLNDSFYNIGLSKFVKKIRVNDFTFSYIQIPKYKHLLKNFITPEEQMKAKYILNIEGNAAAYRYAGLFNMNSVIIQAESKYYTWFEPLLIDGTHYLLLKKDIYMNEKDSIDESAKKTKEFFDTIQKKNSTMKKIAENSTQFYNTYLNESTIYEYYFCLMKKVNSFCKS